MCAGELDLFAPLIQNPSGLTAEQIADAKAIPLRGTAVVLDALAALQIIEKQNNIYTIPERYREVLDINHPRTHIPMIRHLANCLRQWGQLAWTVKAGMPAPEYASIWGPRADVESFILAMNSAATPLVEPLVAKMKAHGLLDFSHFLDIGSGPGTYSMAFLRANPSAKATLFDLQSGLDIAKRRLTEAGLDSRATFVAGDFYRDELPSGADFAWVSAIIHQHDREHSRNLYRKIFTALEPGGRIAVRDFVMNTNRVEPFAGTMFGVNMLANTQTGMVYTFEEIRDDLEASGFGNVQYALPAEDMTAMVTAVKV